VRKLPFDKDYEGKVFMSGYCDKCNDTISEEDIPQEFENHWASKKYIELKKEGLMSLCFNCFLETCLAIKKIARL
jgi:hypothetical protein